MKVSGHIAMAALIATFVLGWAVGDNAPIHGRFVVKDGDESVFENDTPAGTPATIDNSNNLALYSIDGNRSASGRLLNANGFEAGAWGLGGNGTAQTGPYNPWGLYSFIATSPLYDPLTGIPHAKQPGGIALIWEGYYSGLAGNIEQFYRREEIQPDGSVSFEYPRTYMNGRGMDASPQFTLNAPSDIGDTQATLSDYNNGTAGGAHFTIKNDANHVLSLSMYGSGFSDPLTVFAADTAVIKTTAPGGMVIFPGNSSAGTSFDGNLRIARAGNTLLVKSGTNAKAGTVRLFSGTAVVNNTAVTANSTIIVTLKEKRGIVSQQPYVSAISTGTNFTLNGAGTDNSTYNYVIIDSQ
jgi:hypothetical protein